MVAGIYRKVACMPGAEPTREEILAAIRASGYLLEQEVAQRLEGIGFHSTTNRAWEDPDVGQSRELDIWARRLIPITGYPEAAVQLELLCECKNNSYPV